MGYDAYLRIKTLRQQQNLQAVDWSDEWFNVAYNVAIDYALPTVTTLSQTAQTETEADMFARVTSMD